MKKRFTFFAVILTLILHVSYAQKLVETRYFAGNPELGGDVLIKKSTKEVKGLKSVTTFELNSPGYGSYFLNAWLLPTLLQDGSYSCYQISVNGDSIAEKLSPRCGGWQNIGLGTGKIRLRQGVNTISFSAVLPEVPEIEFIRLSPMESKAEISPLKYNRYLTALESGNSIRKNRMAGIEPEVTDTTALTRTILPNPYGNYYNDINIGFGYTFYKTVYFNENQQIFISTNGIDNCGHFLELFSSDMPQTYSWSTVSNSNCLASLLLTIPRSGYYYVKVRTSKNATSGFTNLNINGENYYERVPITSMGFRAIQDNRTEYSSFTCYSIGDPILWIEEGPTIPGKIVAYNDDYGGSGEYEWDNDARIKKQFPRTVHAVLISAYGSYNPSGTCDMYMKCMNSNVMEYFPKLWPDDAIQSAPSSGIYNCISWAGGITSYWEWPDEYSEFYLKDMLEGFDTFYGTERYPGCSIFTREGATAGNSSVDLWGIVDASGKLVEYTHASVRKGADDHPHGYAWESKPGSLMRTFHPRRALDGNAYGQVVEYYRRVDNGPVKSLDESIAEGQAVLEHVEFNLSNYSAILAGLDHASESEQSEFEDLYASWKAVWQATPYSNPNKLKENAQYDALVNFCRSHSFAKYLVFLKLGQGDTFAMLLVKDITLTGNEQNKGTLSKIKASNSRKKTDDNGAMIIRSPYSNCMLYVKELLSADTNSARSSGTTGMTDEPSGVRYSNSDHFTVHNGKDEVVINFSLAKDALVSLVVLDMNGRPVSSLLDKQSFSEGSYCYSQALLSGVYLVKLFVNGNLNVKKVIVE